MVQDRKGQRDSIPKTLIKTRSPPPSSPHTNHSALSTHDHPYSPFVRRGQCVSSWSHTHHPPTAFVPRRARPPFLSCPSTAFGVVLVDGCDSRQWHLSVVLEYEKEKMRVSEPLQQYDARLGFMEGSSAMLVVDTREVVSPSPTFTL